jgi:4-hydroxythreonine-4-phosphate dehydrogenase
MDRIKIGITQGDINGVGYELILKTFQIEEMASLCTPVIYGSPKVATYHRKAINNQTSFQVVESANMAKDGRLNMINCFEEEEQKIEIGQATEEAGAAALTALDAALKDLKSGNIDALVTAPLNSATIKLEDAEAFRSQTEYIEKQIGEGRKALKMLICNNLRIALATDKMPVAEISSSISRDIIAEKLVIVHNTLKRDFFIDNPRIAVLALNPCANGAEEEETITPVIEELFKRGVRCMGPYSTEEFLDSGSYVHFDAILAMYYDQGISVFKTIAQHEGIIYTAGLPFIRTAPVTGVCYDVAGKNEADEYAFRQAIYTAIDTARNRARFDQERSNPLKKQYFEKRDDSDKLKLDQVTEED